MNPTDVGCSVESFGVVNNGKGRIPMQKENKMTEGLAYIECSEMLKRLRLLNKIIMSTCTAILTILFTSIFSSSVFAGEPTRTDLKAYLNLKLSQRFGGLEVKSFNFRNFQGAGEGVGRTSIEGVVRFTEDFVDQDLNFMNRFARRHNLNRQDRQKCRSYFQKKYLSKNFSQPFYKIIANKGEERRFKAEVRYSEGVAGFSFSGWPHIANLRPNLTQGPVSGFQRPIKKPLVGSVKLKSDLEYCLTLRSERRLRDQDIMKQVEKDFTNQRFLVQKFGQDLFRVNTGSETKWERNSSDYLDAWIPGTAVALNDGRWNNDYFDKGDEFNMGFTVDLFKRDDSWDVTMDLAVPDKHGSLYTIGNNFRSKGGIWVREYNSCCKIVPKPVNGNE